VGRARSMEGRLPPDDDDLFEWTDAPARPPREPRREPEPPDTAAEDPLATGERRAVRDTRFRRRRRSDTEETRRVRGDTGEFERSGRRPPPGRRERHRDLPARVRRRQAFAIGAVAVVLIALGGVVEVDQRRSGEGAVPNEVEEFVEGLIGVDQQQ